MSQEKVVTKMCMHTYNSTKYKGKTYFIINVIVLAKHLDKTPMTARLSRYFIVDDQINNVMCVHKSCESVWCTYSFVHATDQFELFSHTHTHIQTYKCTPSMNK